MPDLPDAAHCFVAVHLGHHDVDQGDVDRRRDFEHADALGPAFDGEHLDFVRFEHARQRMMLRMSSSTMRIGLPAIPPSAAWRAVRGCPSSSRFERGSCACRRCLRTRPRARRCRRAFRSPRPRPGCSRPRPARHQNDVDRDPRGLGVVAEQVEQDEAVHVAETQVERDGRGLHLAGDRGRSAPLDEITPLSPAPWTRSRRMPRRLGRPPRWDDGVPFRLARSSGSGICEVLGATSHCFGVGRRAGQRDPTTGPIRAGHRG